MDSAHKYSFSSVHCEIGSVATLVQLSQITEVMACAFARRERSRHWRTPKHGTTKQTGSTARVETGGRESMEGANDISGVPACTKGGARFRLSEHARPAAGERLCGVVG